MSILWFNWFFVKWPTQTVRFTLKLRSFIGPKNISCKIDKNCHINEKLYTQPRNDLFSSLKWKICQNRQNISKIGPKTKISEIFLHLSDNSKWLRKKSNIFCIYTFDPENQRFKSPLLYKTKTKFIFMTIYPNLALQNSVLFQIFKKTGVKFDIISKFPRNLNFSFLDLKTSK